MGYTLDTMKAGNEVISMLWREQRAMGRYSYKLPLTYPNHLNKQNYGVLAYTESFRTNHLCSSSHILSNQTGRLRPHLETSSEALSVISTKIGLSNNARF